MTETEFSNYHIDFRMQLHYLLVVVVSEVSHVIHCRCNICY